jgi:hypothetical protein
MLKGFRRGATVSALLVALPMAELGHLLAYSLRFGPDAAVRQSTGAHAYLPALLQVGAAAAGAALLAVLLLLGIARLMVGLRNDRLPEGGWPVRPLLLTLLGAQLAIFAGQELAEASLAALPPTPAAQLLGWGVAGQLPVALLAAFGLSWISARVRHAVRRLRRSRTLIILARTAFAVAPDWAALPVQRSAQAGRSGFVNRGPPLSPLL